MADKPRPADQVADRIRWDEGLDQTQFTVGYLDRFIGVLETPFAKFDWGEVVQHRIQYYKYKGITVWSKEGEKKDRVDDVFGSLGSGRTIHDVVRDVESGKVAPVESTVPDARTALAAARAARSGRPSKASRYGRSEDEVATHFVCTRVTVATIKDLVNSVQQAIVERAPRLADAINAPSTLHVTVVMLRLVTEEDVATACEVLRGAAALLSTMLALDNPMHIRGVKNFSDGRVVYADVDDHPELVRFQELLSERFAAAGLTLKNTRKFVPHCTIARLTGPALREIRSINSSLYSPFVDLNFGVQPIKGLHLCAIDAPKQADGFFTRIASVRNAVAPPPTAGAASGTSMAAAGAGLSAAAGDEIAIPPVAVLLRQTSDLAKRGVCSTEEKTSLKEAILSCYSGPIGTDVDTAGLSAVARRLQDLHVGASSPTPMPTAAATATTGPPPPTKPSPAEVSAALVRSIVSGVKSGVPSSHVAVIMRGVPGSGKSYIAESIARVASENDVEAIVCSADHFFLDAEGTYNFDASKLKAAHEACLRNFQDGVRRGVPIMVVDNTNTQMWEYKSYVDFAAEHSWPVRVLEVDCPTMDVLKVFTRRNSHGVELKHCKRMWSRWQFDNSATVVQPYGVEGVNSSETVNVNYVGAFLHPTSRAALTAAFAPLHDKVLAHHVTIAFSPDPSRLQALLPVIGEEVTVKVVGHGASPRVQAVAVELVFDGPEEPPLYKLSNNKVPHVTMSIAEKAQARESNDLLEAGFVRLPSSEQLVLKCTIGAFVKGSRRGGRVVYDADRLRAMTEPKDVAKAPPAVPVPPPPPGGAWGKPPAGKPTKQTSAGLLLVRERTAGTNEVLMVCRNRKGRFELAKGRVEPGESADEAAVRELGEEAGVTSPVTVLQLLHTNKYTFTHSTDGPIEKVVLWFLAHPLDGSSVMLGPREKATETVQWVSLDEVVSGRVALRTKSDVDLIRKAVVACGEREAPVPPPRITSLDKSEPPGFVSPVPHSLVPWSADVHTLNIFDFDDTLFHTTGPEEGKRLYQLLTGNMWTLPGWLNFPESLDTRMGVVAATALHAMRRHLGVANSLTIVSTGRIESMRDGVVAFLDHEQLSPDRIFLRPLAAKTEAAKRAVLREMFREFPSIRTVNVWEDRDDMLAVYQASLRDQPGVTANIIDAKTLVPPAMPAVSDMPSGVQDFITLRGLQRTPEHVAAVLGGLRVLNQAWWSALYGPSPPDCPYGDALPFLGFLHGSYPLGRSSSDVDVCLVGPAYLEELPALERLSAALTAAGVSFQHLARSKRCPRLLVKVFPVDFPAFELDVIACMVPPDMVPSYTNVCNMVTLTELAKVKVSPKSELALLGPLTLNGVLEVVSTGLPGPGEAPAPMEHRLTAFGMVVEVVARLLASACLSGVVFHALRTRHVITLLSQHVSMSAVAAAQLCSATVQVDSLLQGFLAYVAGLTAEQWQRLVGSDVPPLYLEPLGQLFASAAEWLAAKEAPLQEADIQKLISAHRVDGVAAPFTPVRVKYRAAPGADSWRLHNLLRGRLQSHIRRLISKGIHVVPGRVTTIGGNAVSFYVPNTEAVLATLRKVLAALDADLEEVEGARVRVSLHSA